MQDAGNTLCKGLFRGVNPMLVSLVALALAAPAPAAEPQAEPTQESAATITAVKGSAKTGAGAAASHAAVLDGDTCETGEDGNASLLLDRDTVVELCGQTLVAFKRDPKKGNRVIQVDAGEVRLVVDPREPGEQIEIHTPAAIATILGTVVYVSVDPVTGETTISSSQSQVNIRSVDEQKKASTTIDALESLTLLPGDEVPKDKKKLTRGDIDTLGGCFVDFHDLAVDVDRIPLESKSTSRVVDTDLANVSLDDVALPAPIFVAPPPPPEGQEDGPKDQTETDPKVVSEMFMMDPRTEIPTCGPVPGDHCSF